METNLIQLKNEEPITTSIIVAEKFKKQHTKVIRAIENIIEGIANFGDTPKMFDLVHVVNNQNGQAYPMYEMNRDGFTLLAMGFTGKEALEWKLKYIEAFNEMEKRINSPTLPDNRLELVKLMSKAKDFRVADIKPLYPEYFSKVAENGSLEYISDLNTSYLKWKEDYNITKDWIGYFPTLDIYNNYVRYCVENNALSMGKKLFYSTLESDFNLTKKQRGNGQRYFISA